MKFPDDPIKGVPVAHTMGEVIDYLRPRPGMPGSAPPENVGTWDTLPPFWPILSGDGAGAYSFTLTDGYVCERVPGTGDAIADLADHIPTGISSGGERTSIAITSGQQISIRIETNPDGEIYDVTCVVETEDAASINPNEDTATYGDIHIKLAVLRAATGAYDAYLQYYLAGSHIYYDRDGGGSTGYVTFIRDMAGGGTSYAKLYVRYVNGRMTETLDGWNGSTAVTPPAGWGSQIYEVAFFGAAGYGAANSSW